ncbi:MAG: hypothetical protein [Circular genetic element sp.]|nr:MAG: hypothetical protein [Circular genetic element sp.]
MTGRPKHITECARFAFLITALNPSIKLSDIMSELLCVVCSEVFKIYKTLESVAPWLCECPKKSETVNVQGTFMGYGIYWRTA